MPANPFFSPAFIETIMQEHNPEKAIKVLYVIPFPVDNSASILAVLTAGRTTKPIGHFGLEVHYTLDDQPLKKRMVMKIKPDGTEIVDMLNSLATACGAPLAEIYAPFKDLTGFRNTHGRELEIYGKLSGEVFPEVYGIYADPEDATYIILMEYLENVELLNSVMQPEEWTNEHIQTALTQIAAWHAAHLNKPLPLNPKYWTDAPSPEYMHELTPLWEGLVQNAEKHFSDLYSPERAVLLKEAITEIPDYWQELQAMPKTLIHNDLNPRNTCFKRNPNNTLNFCVYDWELATWHVPQYDVVEFLCFVLEEDRYDLRLPYLEFYRQELHRLTNLFPDAANFQRGFYLAALDFGLHRLGMYLMAHTISPYPFLPRVVNSYFNALKQTKVQPVAQTETAHN